MAVLREKLGVIVSGFLTYDVESGVVQREDSQSLGWRPVTIYPKTLP